MQENQQTEIQRNNLSKNKPLYKIILFFILWFIFALMTVVIKNIIINAVSASSAHKIGNGFISFSQLHNSGIAFGLFNGYSNIIIFIAIIALIVITSMVIIKIKEINKTLLITLSMMNAGIFMNLTERIQNGGYVLDYIEVVPDLLFNAADILIVLSSISLAIIVYRYKK